MQTSEKYALYKRRNMENIYEIVGPISLCPLSYDSGERRLLSYCRNRNLIKMISEIGTICSDDFIVEKSSDDVHIIQAKLLRRNITISKQVIKRLFRLKKKRIVITQKNSYSRGVRIIQAELLGQNITVSKEQIRRLARPNYRKKHVVKIPYQSVEILQAVYNIIHGSKNSYLLIKECQKRKTQECSRRKLGNILCREFLIGELYELLEKLRGSFEKGSGAEYVMGKLDSWVNKC